MIRIGVQTGRPVEAYGIDDAYRIIKEAGFDAADANIDHLLNCATIKKRLRTFAVDAGDKTCLEYFKPWKDAAEKYGIDNYQAHALFPTYVQDASGEYNEYLLETIRKMIMGCDYMNCRRLIVHPFFFGYDNQMDPDFEWNLNIEKYSALIPDAKRYGVAICLENMFGDYRDKVYYGCCSDITTACRYIDTLNGIAGEKCFGFCLDTGHLLLLGKDVKAAMIQLGDRIEAFHVHDNDGRSDQHIPPYMGILDWERFVEGLKAIKFSKTISFETFKTYSAFDWELYPEVMRLIAQTGRMFASRAQADA